jgi:omega-hydroxy-beta-dihydromenaquinone-9 sulfotransferase
MPLAFQTRLLSVLVFKTLFRTRGTDGRLTPKRILVLLVMFPAYFLTLVFNWIGLLLDEVLFWRYRRQVVERPMFIVGPPRTGSTLLQRLLAESGKFSSLKTWEILFAPSITQKFFWYGVGALDRALGRPAARTILAFEGWAFRDFNRMHKVGLFEPEEDDPILHNIFATGFAALVLPFRADVLPLVFFDEHMPPKNQRRIMAFYRRCVQRHLFVFGRGRRFLSKNPSFSFKVDAVRRTFPDARFVCLVRNPLQTVPSTFSFLSYFYDVFCSRRADSPSQAFIHELLAAWYRIPTQKLRGLPDDQQMILRYEDLVANPGAVALACLERLGYAPSDTTRDRLAAETETIRSFKSGHTYTYDDRALSPARIAADYADIMETFDYPAPEADPEENRS